MNPTKNEPGFTPGPWKADRRNWRNELVDHEIYIRGNEYEDPGDGDLDEDEEPTPCLVSTGVAIVEGNATSRGTTYANARLIAAAPDLYEAAKRLLDVIAEPNQIVHEMLMDAAVRAMDDAVAKADGRGR